MKLYKIIFTSLFLLIFISACVHSAYDFVEELNKYVPENFYRSLGVFFYDQSPTGLYYSFDEDPSAPFFLQAVTNDTVTQILIFEVQNHQMKKIWESNMFYGRLIDATAIKFNDIKCRHFVIITMCNDKLAPDYQKKYIWVLSWDREKTSLVDVQDTGSNMLVTEGTSFIKTELFKQRIITVTNRDDGRLSRYYTLVNEELVLDEEKFISNISTLNTVQTTVYVDPIQDFLVNKYPHIEISRINYINEETGLVLVESNIGKIVMNRRFDDVEEWYIFDEKYDHLYYGDFTLGHDLNKDGYYDLILTNFDEVLYRQVYYIFTLEPTGPKLISPLREDGVSRIWSDGGSLFIVSEYDGSYSIYCVDQYAEPADRLMIWEWNSEKNLFEQI